MYRQFSSLRKRLCPKCGVDMQNRRLTRSVRADSCPDCAGVWFDHGEIKGLLLGRITERAGRRDMLLADEVEWQCPDCRLPLLARELIRGSGLRVYQCRRCAGSFMENGSVSRLLELLKGLPAAGKATGGPRETL